MFLTPNWSLRSVSIGPGMVLPSGTGGNITDAASARTLRLFMLAHSDEYGSGS